MQQEERRGGRVGGKCVAEGGGTGAARAGPEPRGLTARGEQEGGGVATMTAACSRLWWLLRGGGSSYYTDT